MYPTISVKTINSMIINVMNNGTFHSKKFIILFQLKLNDHDRLQNVT